VPASLIQAQTRALANDVAQNLKRQGADDKTIQEILLSEMENISKKAENQVKASLIVEAVAKAEKFEVTAEDIDAEISKMATSMKVEEPKVKEFYLNNPSRKEDLEYRIREERTLGWLLEKAKIKDAK
jgi:trigger factor